MSRGIVLAVVLMASAFAGPGDAQVGTDEISLDVLKNSDSADAKKFGLTPEMIQNLDKLGKATLAEHPASFEPGAKAGVLIVKAADGAITTAAIPTDKPNQIIVKQDALESLHVTGSLNLTGARPAHDALLKANIERAVDPTSTDEPVPQKFQRSADAARWKGSAGTYPPACIASRIAFTNMAEQQLLGEGSDPAQQRPDDERAQLINVAKNYDKDCLVKVTPELAAAQKWPLGFVAVVAAGNGQTYCMAAYLGGQRFLTARHCLYDDSGNLRPQAAGATLSLADRSAVRLPLTIAPVQPIAAPQSPSSPADIVLVTANVPAAIAARPGPVLTGALGNVMISRALVIGYFALADPERLIPPLGGTGEYPDWAQSLRATQELGEGYCRIFDYTPPNPDGTGCIEHSCQTVPGFSGAPVFVRRGDGQWTLGGIHVTTGEDVVAKKCAAFAGRPDGGVLGEYGGLAAQIPNTVRTAGGAASTILANRQ